MERRTKIPGPDGRLIDGFEVPVAESTERWSEVALEDGTILRVKASILSAVRIPGQFDQDGNPMYVLKAANTMMIAEAPDRFKRGYVEGAKKAN